MKKFLAILVLSLLWCNVGFAEVKFQKTKLKIDDLVQNGYRLFAVQLEGGAVGNGVYVFTKDTLTKDSRGAESIFHCYVAMKGLPKKVETCYNLTPSAEID